MKKILTVLKTFKIAEEPYHPVYGLYDPYVKYFLAHNLIPIFVVPIYSRKIIDALYASCDGVYFLGGTDFHPEHYGKEKHRETIAFDAARDEAELYIAQKVLQDKKPFLGICLGMQAMNIVSGGTLHQHLPDIFPQEDHRPHRGYGALSDHFEVQIDPTSKIYKIFGEPRLKVTCIHHQGVDTVGKGFRIAAKSAGGVIEALEHEDPNYFCYGVQFHPELSNPGPVHNLFQAFAQAVENTPHNN